MVTHQMIDVGCDHAAPPRLAAIRLGIERVGDGGHTVRGDEVEAENMVDALKYLEDGLVCEVVFYEGKAISVELPNSVVREVIYTEPAVKGDTSGKVMKPARLATGFELPVPAFVAIDKSCCPMSSICRFASQVWKAASCASQTRFTQASTFSAP